MSWAVINLCEELKARVEKAILSGSLVCKDVFVGDFEQIRNPNDYPICVIIPASIRSNAKCMRHGITDITTINIVYIFNKLALADNKIYKTTDATGILYNLAIILNYLEKKTSDGSVDLTINAKTDNLFNYNISFDYGSNDIIKAVISFEAQTTQYIRAAR